MNKTLITGATGLTGSHVAEYFLQNNENTVCMVRKSGNIDFLKQINAPIRYGDIIDTHSLLSAMQDVGTVIHTAAKVADWGDYDKFYETNVIGTINVLRAAYLSGIKDVIITGSISCYGEEDSKKVKDEDCEYASHYKYFMDSIFPSAMNFYRDTKAQANIEAIKYAEEKMMNLTIIEPAWIYGEREFHSGIYDYLKTLKSGLKLMPGSKKNKFHTIYARDLAKIYYLAYKSNLKGIHKILAVDPEPKLQYQLLDALTEEAGLAKPKRIPKSTIYPPAFILEALYKLIGIDTPPPISRARVNIFYDNIEYSCKKAQHLLGFTPDHTFQEGVANTVKWYKENNLL
jgi:nucleoside-diphosphate-sugar epimerase